MSRGSIPHGGRAGAALRGRQGSTVSAFIHGCPGSFLGGLLPTGPVVLVCLRTRSCRCR